MTLRREMKLGEDVRHQLRRRHLDPRSGVELGDAGVERSAERGELRSPLAEVVVDHALVRALFAEVWVPFQAAVTVGWR